jgi:CRISPR-associated protein Cas2
MASEKFVHLSGYKFMWVMVLFDLPTSTKEERRRYTLFREFLLNNAFEMAQYSVYVRHTNGKDAIEAIVRKVEASMPAEGKVDILQFTDKQYENIICLRGDRRVDSPKNPTQLLMF